MALLAASTLYAATLATGIGTPAGSPASGLRPVAEFEAVRAVALSDDYMQGGYDGIALVRAILEAGAQALILSSNTVSTTMTSLAASDLSKAMLAKTKVLQLAHDNLWLRDYGPLFVRDHTGVAAIDFIWGGPGQDNEVFPQKIAKTFAMPVRSLPVTMDGGNFLTDGKICVMSRLSSQTEAPDPQLLSRIGCERTVIINNPPHAHVDMWLKFVAPGKALIPELNSSARQALKRHYGGTIPTDQQQFAERLDAVAQELSAYVQVERIPSPVLYRGTYRTYTNAILVNRQAIVPRFRSYGWGYDTYPDTAELKDYEQAVEKSFKANGYSVTFVDADGIIYNGGAFHCVTIQIPE